ncbi:hypothetical protein ATY38_06530 [Nitrosomonas ureae]|nr:hypothetical protein ATY38_06530 [Nitrosomonas ureae]
MALEEILGEEIVPEVFSKDQDTGMIEVCYMNDLTPSDRIISGRTRFWDQKAQSLKLERRKKRIVS